MRAVVTGASGFVGQRLVRRLAETGWEVVAAVRDPARLPEVLALGGADADLARVRAVPWSAGDPLELGGADVVFHLAAHRPARYDDPAEAERCLQVNAVATGRLVEDAARAGVGRFLFVSSTVYRPLSRPAREDDPLEPSTRAPYYHGSKICGEWLVAAASTRIATTIARPSAIYGPGMPPGMVAAFVSALAAGLPVVVADGGRYTADLVYVDDVVDAVIAAVDRGVSGPLNVGGGRVHTALEVAWTAADVLGRPRSLVRVEPAGAGAPGGLPPLDVSRAVGELGYTPRSLEDGLRAFGSVLRAAASTRGA